jgi:phage-related minor tail protein
VAKVGEAFIDIKADVSGFQAALSSGVGNALGAAEREAKGFTDRLGDTLRGAGDKISGVGTKVSSAGSTLSKNVTLPLVGIGTAGFMAARSVEDALRTIRVGTGATGGELERLNADFEFLARNSSQSVDRVGTVVADLNTRLGLSGAPMRDLAMQVLDLEQITGGTETNLDTLTRVFGAFQVAPEEYGETLDKLFRASQATGVEFNSLQGTLVSQSAAFSELGFNIDDTVAILGQFEAAGVNTETVLGGLRQNIVKAAGEGESAADFFRAGVSTIEDYLAAGDEAGAQAAAKELFGARTFLDALDAIKRGQFNIDGTVAKIVDGADSIGGLADETSNFSNDFAQFRNNMAFQLAPIGEKLIPLLTTALETIIPIIEKVLGVFEKMSPGMQTAAIAIGGILAVLGPIFMVLGPIIGIIGKLVAAVAFLASPIGLVVAAIALVVAITVIVIKNFDTIKAVVKRVMDAVVGFFKAAFDKIRGFLSRFFNIVKGVFNSIKDFVGGIFDAVAGFFSTMIDKIVGFLTAFFEVFVDIWNTILGFLEGVFRIFEIMFAIVLGIYVLILESLWKAFKKIWDIISEYVSKVFDAIKDAFEVVFDVMVGILEWFAGIFETIWDVISSVFQAFADLARKVWDTVFDALEKVLNTFKGIFDTVWGTISGIFTTVMDTVRGAWDTMINALLDIAQPILDAIMGAFDTLWGGITGIFDKIQTTADTVFGKVKEFAVTAFDTVLSTMKTIVNGILSGIESGLNFGVGALNTLIRAANRVPRVNISEISEISLPRLANGAIVGSPMLAQIGEAGAEAVIPLTRPGRALQLMEQSGLADLVRNNRTQMGGAAVNIQNATFVKGTDADLVAQKVLAAWRSRSVA